MPLLTLRRALVALTMVAVGLVGAASPGFAAVTSPSPTVASVQPRPGELVGVAAQVTVTFTTSVANRVAAERAFAVPEGMTGQFSWPDAKTLQFKPDGFWPAHSVAPLSVDGFKTDVTTGAAVLGVASISQHTFTVSIDGEVARTMPASMGKPSRPTPIGSYSVLSREQSVVMDSRTIGIPLSDPEGYKITAYYAERITGSGVYVHSAPWSVDSQGYANVSHGCINLSPDNAAWYYNTVHIGDPVIVKA
jgi:lipoprotein-anchoring transpeptidase ErfK/SrfK